MMVATFAQTQTLKTVTSGSVTLDTVTNTESEYLYGVLAPGFAGHLALQLVATKISGTPNGVATIEFSADGVNYETINANDTFHVAPTTSSTHIWYVTSLPTYYFRIKVTGRGTAAIKINGIALYRRD